MSKEYLEAFETVYNNIDYLISDVVIEDNEVSGCLMTIKEQLLTIEQALLRLEAIDNANPSEALELVDKMANYILLDEEYGFIDEKEKQAIIKDRDTIKRALLKAQEPKKYLKWEDLKFTKKSKEMLVKLGDTTYPIRYYKVNDNINKVCISSFQFIEIYDIRFFNDLHLEVIEE